MVADRFKAQKVIHVLIELGPYLIGEHGINFFGILIGKTVHLISFRVVRQAISFAFIANRRTAVTVDRLGFNGTAYAGKHQY